jgi:hypothetical protein
MQRSSISICSALTSSSPASDGLRRLQVALHEGLDGPVHPLLDHRPHVEEAVLERLQVRLEVMPFHACLSYQPNRPVM